MSGDGIYAWLPGTPAGWTHLPGLVSREILEDRHTKMDDVAQLAVEFLISQGTEQHSFLVVRRGFVREYTVNTRPTAVRAVPQP